MSTNNTKIEHTETYEIECKACKHTDTRQIEHPPMFCVECGSKAITWYKQ